MKKLKSIFIGTLTFCAVLSGMEKNNYVMKNPFNFAVEKIPIVVDYEGNKNLTFYDINSKKNIPTQKDILPEGKKELICLVDLLPGEKKYIGIKESNEFSMPESFNNKATYDENKQIYAISNGSFQFSLGFRKDTRKGWENIYHVVCSNFQYLDNNRETGIKQISDPQLGVFNKKPEVTVISGPVRLQIIISGKGELRSGNSIVSGSLRCIIRLYEKKPVFESETTFIPESDGQLYLVAAGETAVIAGETEKWSLFSISHKTGKDVSVVFGEKQNTGDEGTKWVSAVAADKAFSYVYDDINSNISATKGEGGIERSKVVFRISNFSEKANYIRPDFFGIKAKKEEPLILKMRITFYPAVPEEKDFALKDYRVFQTDFLLPRLVKETFSFSGDVALSRQNYEKINKILNTRDVFILTGEKINKEQLDMIKKLSEYWQMPALVASDISDFLNFQYFKNDCQNTAMILIGSPEDNLIVRAHNKKYGFVDGYFPGEGKGIISVIENFPPDTDRPVIHVGGMDSKSVMKAIAHLMKNFSVSRMKDLQVRVMPPELRPRPWMRKEKIESVSLKVCKGETEPVHLLLYTPEQIKNLEVICDVKNSEGRKIECELSYIPWSFAGVDLEGNIYPEGKEAICFEEHPLPHATYLPGSIKKEGQDIPFITHIANHDAMWLGLPPRIPANRQLSLWINFRINNDVPSGLYEGNITIKCESQEKKIPVKIEVLNIQLPSQWAMDFFAMYSLDNYNENVFKLYLDIDKNDEKTYLKAIQSLGNLLYSHGSTVANISAYDMKIKISPDGNIELEPDELNKIIRAYREGNFNGWFEMSLPLHYWEPMIEAISKFKSISFEEAKRIFFEKLKEWMKKENIKVIARVGDEPGDADKWAEMASKLKNSGFLITVCHNRADEQFTRKMIGTIDIWCPLWNRAITGWMGEILPDDEPSRFNRKFFNERKQAGEIIWNYTCATPYFSLTRLPTEIYFYFWDSFNKGFDGVVYYGGGYWCHMWGGDDLPGVKGHIAHRDYYVYNVYARNKKSDWVGGTTIFYPDARKKEVISSQRWEIVRQAQEDVKLFSLIRKKYGDSELSNILFSVVSPRNHIDIPPEDFHKVRQEAIKLLLSDN
ncbi:MAG: DUF4091 domain-containing protein [Candidatus Omnitrophica bacterium]|nr:DUF4091 domain-containing protein [Candidatus Omnitrophota bacterium]